MAITTQHYKVPVKDGKTMEVKITYQDTGWWVDTSDLSQFVPNCAVKLPTPANITAEAYKIQETFARR